MTIVSIAHRLSTVPWSFSTMRGLGFRVLEGSEKSSQKKIKIILETGVFCVEDA